VLIKKKESEDFMKLRRKQNERERETSIELGDQKTFRFKKFDRIKYSWWESRTQGIESLKKRERVLSL
jgi:hypothetical protein